MNNKVRDLFRKTCINELPSYEYIPPGYAKDGQTKVPRTYRREDFTRFAKEAFERGEDHFYTEPVDLKVPNGAHKLCGPKYVYELKKSLSEKEFEEYFGYNAELSVETVGGTLSAHFSSDVNFPGIYVELTPKDADCIIDMALVQRNADTGKFDTYVWGDAANDDYTHKIELSNLDKLKEVVQEEQSSSCNTESTELQQEKLILKNKPPVYELYKRMDGRYNLRTCFYNKDQVNEFAATAGKYILSASGINEMIDKIQKEGKYSFIWDVSRFDVLLISPEYVAKNDRVVNCDVSQIRECMQKYLNANSCIYEWTELGVNESGELAYLCTNGSGTMIRGIMGEDGYPDILNDQNESVFNYAEEMNLTQEDVDEIRGIQKSREEQSDGFDR